jgi:hypothetical protein
MGLIDSNIFHWFRSVAAALETKEPAIDEVAVNILYVLACLRFARHEPLLLLDKAMHHFYKTEQSTRFQYQPA